METDLYGYISNLVVSGSLSLNAERISEIVKLLEKECYGLGNLGAMTREDAIAIQFPLGIWTCLWNRQCL